MKSESDNYRSSAILEIISKIKKMNYEVIIYEPICVEKTLIGCRIVNDINKFKKKSETIVANRIDKFLVDVTDKVYTRDIYNDN